MTKKEIKLIKITAMLPCHAMLFTVLCLLWRIEDRKSDVFKIKGPTHSKK